MFGTTLSTKKDYFSLADRFNGFSLKNRLWAQLVEKLVLMKYEGNHPADPKVSVFSSDGEVIRVRTTSKWNSDVDSMYYKVEILDDKLGVIIVEELPRSMDENYHPMFELFELLDQYRLNRRVVPVNLGEIKLLANLAKR